MKQFTHIYIDESGDMGSKSRFIVFGIVASSSNRSLEKIIKKLWKAKPQYHNQGELHATNSDENTINKMLRALNHQDVKLYYSVLIKGYSSTDNMRNYYQELARLTVHFNASKVIIDKKDTASKRARFIKDDNKFVALKKASFEESHKTKPLQAADFVAWAVARSYEKSDNSFIMLMPLIKRI